MPLREQVKYSQLRIYRGVLHMFPSVAHGRNRRRRPADSIGSIKTWPDGGPKKIAENVKRFDQVAVRRGRVHDTEWMLIFCIVACFFAAIARNAVGRGNGLNIFRIRRSLRLRLPCCRFIAEQGQRFLRRPIADFHAFKLRSAVRF